jgi:putative oxidoreductase
MADVQAEPKLLLPRLRSFYDVLIPLSWLIIRFAAGWNLFVHAWGKIQIGATPNMIKSYTEIGFEPGMFWYLTSTTNELLGGIGLILGLFTRFFATTVAVEMLVITIVYWNTGFAWTRRGYEYVLMWGLVSFAIALRGGGPYSLDRKIGTEL